MLALCGSILSSIWKHYNNIEEVSVLILGTPSSGKTSLFEQIKKFNNINNTNNTTQTNISLPTSSSPKATNQNTHNFSKPIPNSTQNPFLDYQTENHNLQSKTLIYNEPLQTTNDSLHTYTINQNIGTQTTKHDIDTHSSNNYLNKQHLNIYTNSTSTTKNDEPTLTTQNNTCTPITHTQSNTPTTNTDSNLTTTTPQTIYLTRADNNLQTNVPTTFSTQNTIPIPSTYTYSQIYHQSDDIKEHNKQCHTHATTNTDPLPTTFNTDPPQPTTQCDCQTFSNTNSSSTTIITNSLHAETNTHSTTSDIEIPTITSDLHFHSTQHTTQIFSCKTTSSKIETKETNFTIDSCTGTPSYIYTHNHNLSTQTYNNNPQESQSLSSNPYIPSQNMTTNETSEIKSNSSSHIETDSEIHPHAPTLFPIFTHPTHLHLSASYENILTSQGQYEILYNNKIIDSSISNTFSYDTSKSSISENTSSTPGENDNNQTQDVVTIKFENTYEEEKGKASNAYEEEKNKFLETSQSSKEKAINSVFLLNETSIIIPPSHTQNELTTSENDTYNQDDLSKLQYNSKNFFVKKMAETTNPSSKPQSDASKLSTHTSVGNINSSEVFQEASIEVIKEASTLKEEKSSYSFEPSSVGVNFTKVNLQDMNAVLLMTDLSSSLHSYWRDYIPDTDVVVYVMDGSDINIIPEIRNFLPTLITYLSNNTPIPHPSLLLVSNIFSGTIHPKVLHELDKILTNHTVSSPVLICSTQTGDDILPITQLVVKKGLKRKEILNSLPSSLPPPTTQSNHQPHESNETKNNFTTTPQFNFYPSLKFPPSFPHFYYSDNDMDDSPKRKASNT